MGEFQPLSGLQILDYSQIFRIWLLKLFLWASVAAVNLYSSILSNHNEFWDFWEPSKPGRVL